MRPRPTATLLLMAVCAGAGGPALASVAARAPRTGTGSADGSPPITSIQTTTTQTQTPTTTPVPQLSVCLKAERRVIARALGVRVAAVAHRQRVGSNSMPQCNYLVRRAHAGGPHRRVAVVVNVDNGPQAGWRLMRKVVEATQIWGPVPKGFAPPIGLSGLGPYASWFPSLDQLMANNVNRHYLLTVSIIWGRAKRAEMIGLARAAALPYRRIARLAA